MKTLIATLSLAVAATGLVLAPSDADAKRLGGGKAAGMQRQTPAQPANATPPTPAQPVQATPAPANTAAAATGTTAAGTAAAAQAGKRSWLGPIAGLAAGLGIAALLSHFGLGAAFAEFFMLLLLVGAAFFIVRWAMRRFAGAPTRLAGAGAGAGSAGADLAMPRVSTPAGVGASWTPPGQTGAPSATQPSAMPAVPDDFDREAFERIAKMIFVRLQAANDAGNVDDLRKFTTPELFASIRVDLQDRGGIAQKTDVVQLEAQIVDAAREADQWVVSVRFKGLIREQSESGAESFAELWHLVRPLDGSRDWAIAGITPVAG